MAADKRVAVVRLIVKFNQRLPGNKWLSTGRPGFMAAYTIQAWAGRWASVIVYTLLHEWRTVYCGNTDW